jgi:hypothetical protein
LVIIASVASGPSTELIRHFFWNFLAAIVIFAAAVGCAYVEIWCEGQKLPPYVGIGIRVISVILFIIDGVVICGTAAIVAYKLLRKTMHNEP